MAWRRLVDLGQFRTARKQSPVQFGPGTELSVHFVPGTQLVSRKGYRGGIAEQDRGPYALSVPEIA
eukprot:495246-Rhodomonas_salina.1